MQAELLHDELLGALEALGGSAGNGKLRELLGWDEATYDAVKTSLVSAGRLQPGRGRGGSISLTQANGTVHQSNRPLLSEIVIETPKPVQPTGKQNLSAFIWSVADLLRGDYKQSEYGKVILPFTVLRKVAISPVLTGPQATAVREMPYGNQSQVWLRVKDRKSVV